MNPAKKSNDKDSAGLIDPRQPVFPNAVRETSSYPVADLAGRVFLRACQLLELLVLRRAKDRSSVPCASELSKRKQGSG